MVDREVRGKEGYVVGLGGEVCVVDLGGEVRGKEGYVVDLGGEVCVVDLGEL